MEAERQFQREEGDVVGELRLCTTGSWPLCQNGHDLSAEREQLTTLLGRLLSHLENERGTG